MTELIIGLISGFSASIIASLVFYIFLFGIKPKINVSDKISKTVDRNGKTIYVIKIVNKTKNMLTDVKYNLSYCEPLGDNVYFSEDISPINAPLEFVYKYSKKDEKSDYAIRVTYDIDVETLSSSDAWLEFTFYAKHAVSNTSACINKRYNITDIVDGIFETGTSMRILSMPNQSKSKTKVYSYELDFPTLEL